MANTSSGLVVGIGASAGGIEAFREFFEHMPSTNGICFIVILHLAPDRPSMLAGIIGHWTTMNVVQAEDGMLIEAERIYVNPPNAIVTVRDGRLHVRAPNSAQRETLPIDIFFNSLAADQGEKAVGVVLSGTGSDGALGLKAIKAAGGVTIAQGSDGSAPQYGSMPDAAIATGAVDVILPVEAIAEHILVLNQGLASPEAVPFDAAKQQQIENARLDICAILRSQVGHDFSQYKEPTFLRRVQRRMHGTSLEAGEYVERLREDFAENILLFRDLLIGVTSFFRDSNTFDALREHLPPMFKGKGPDDSVRVWVPGCSTGEEAYSIAILLREHMDTLEFRPKLQIFATDIDEAAIAIARAGRYPALLLNDVSTERRARFFTAGNAGYVVTKELRDYCTFSAHSVIRDPPFSRISLVSCRNLLIYLDPQLQDRVIPGFHYALAPGGIMMLGRSEAITRHDSLFAMLDKQHRIFIRNDVPTPPLQILAPTIGRSSQPAADRKTDMKINSGKAVQAANTRMQRQFSPAYVLVNVEGNAIHYAPRVGRYLELSIGEPTRNVVAMARRGLKPELQLMLRKVMEVGRPLTQDRVRVEVEGGVQFITLTVEPLSAPDSEPLYLVVFDDDGPVRSHLEGADRGQTSHQQDELAEQHEREVRDFREQLQSASEEYETAVEELKSANEELQSTNEELQSANEELETSREEIQSINEELHTANHQLTSKVGDLDKANSDLTNLFESTKVATVFLDRNLIVRNFTPALVELYNLIPSDRGRRFTDITSNIVYPELKADFEKVLETLEPQERRVTRGDRSAQYLMRMLPYRATNDAVEGALVTFVDVTGIVQAEEHHRLLVDELNHRVKNMLTVVISMVQQTRRGRDDIGEFCEVFLGRVHALAAAYSLLSREQWAAVGLEDILLEELSPYKTIAGGSNIVLEGPPVSLKPSSALAFGMIVHELATNAVKYGALSVPGGRVAIQWNVEAGVEGRQLVWRWAERDGPAVTPPDRQGFGLKLIERSIEHELGGTSVMEFSEAGVDVVLTMPLQATSGARAVATATEDLA